jgi:hypothetical protein
MAELMTIEQIESLFPNEWILVIDPDTGPDLRVRSGMVAAHDKNRAEVYKTAMKIAPKRSAIWYNGDPIGPDDCAIL